jgi:hypothetical protein
MTDARQQPLPGPDPEKPGEPFTIEPHLPTTDEDGERIYPEDAPREGEGAGAEGTISGYIGENEGTVPPTT